MLASQECSVDSRLQKASRLWKTRQIILAAVITTSVVFDSYAQEAPAPDAEPKSSLEQFLEQDYLFGTWAPSPASPNPPASQSLEAIASVDLAQPRPNRSEVPACQASPS